ncbi:MAG TPA: hypothetical protein VIA06_18225 [Candidatus Dormibacteraeota bacterium]|nr:hypothetical protein [Candidatus Dormibacteraeota bacterium]
MIVRSCTPLAATGDGYRPTTRFGCDHYPGTVPLHIFFEVILQPELVGVPIPFDVALSDESHTTLGSDYTFVWNKRRGDNTYFSYIWRVEGIQVPKPDEYLLEVYIAARLLRSIWIHCVETAA